MSKFGWSYPAGAENDHNAPYNQEDGFNPWDFWQANGKALAEAFPDHEGPGSLYRSAYKYTDCGPSVGVEIACNHEDEDGSEGVQHSLLYCDDLYTLASWAGETASSAMVVAFNVSSIVEGVERCTDTIEVVVFDMENCCTRSPKDIAKDFWEAVENTDKQANEIWMETHGCDSCETHHGRGEYDEVVVWAECPECKGQGVCI